MMPDDQLLDKLINKIRQQWNTVRKAFSDFNEDNDPYIDKDELVFFLEHWGFPLTEQ
jgi:Ca2+-binding EF-hand superfamily protein